MEFEGLMRRVDFKLWGIAKKLDGRYTAFDDNDLHQQALLHLWEKNKEGEFEDKTDSFILQGCFFFLKNHIRKIHKTIDRNTSSLNTSLDDKGTTLEDLLPSISKDKVLGEIEAKLLYEGIYTMLDNRERVVFSLSLDDISGRQIAKKLGISHVMVGKIKRKIINRCKPFINELFIK